MRSNFFKFSLITKHMVVKLKFHPSVPLVNTVESRTTVVKILTGRIDFGSTILSYPIITSQQTKVLIYFSAFSIFFSFINFVSRDSTWEQEGRDNNKDVIATRVLCSMDIWEKGNRYRIKGCLDIGKNRQSGRGRVGFHLSALCEKTKKS